MISIISVLMAGLPAMDAVELKDLAKETKSVSKLDWHLMKMNLLFMQKFNYPSKPTFMGVDYNKDAQTVTMQFEIRKSFLEFYQSKEGVVNYLKSFCEPQRYLFHHVDSSLDETWKKWLQIKFRQQGGGDGRDIAVYENGEFKVNVPQFLTPPIEESNKPVAGDGK